MAPPHQWLPFQSVPPSPTCWLCSHSLRACAPPCIMSFCTHVWALPCVMNMSASLRQQHERLSAASIPWPLCVGDLSCLYMGLFPVFHLLLVTDGQPHPIPVLPALDRPHFLGKRQRAAVGQAVQRGLWVWLEAAWVGVRLEQACMWAQACWCWVEASKRGSPGGARAEAVQCSHVWSTLLLKHFTCNDFRFLCDMRPACMSPTDVHMASAYGHTNAPYACSSTVAQT